LAPAVRGKGLGNAMLEEIIARSRKEEVRALFLEVEEDNLPAVKLYTRHGFKTRPYILQSLVL
jgi:ribosomal protein S18 acetylase RimI-like enzyme